MSIYSGFATRKMQENYNSLLSKLILLFQQNVLECLSIQTSQYLEQNLKPGNRSRKSNHKFSDEQQSMQSQQQNQFHGSHGKRIASGVNKFMFIFSEENIKRYSQIFTRMKLYEEHKYLEPKFSELCSPLLMKLGIYAQVKKKDYLVSRASHEMIADPKKKGYSETENYQSNDGQHKNAIHHEWKSTKPRRVTKINTESDMGMFVSNEKDRSQLAFQRSPQTKSTKSKSEKINILRKSHEKKQQRLKKSRLGSAISPKNNQASFNHTKDSFYTPTSSNVKRGSLNKKLKTEHFTYKNQESVYGKNRNSHPIIYASSSMSKTKPSVINSFNVVQNGEYNEGNQQGSRVLEAQNETFIDVSMPRPILKNGQRTRTNVNTPKQMLNTGNLHYGAIEKPTTNHKEEYAYQKKSTSSSILVMKRAKMKSQNNEKQSPFHAVRSNLKHEHELQNQMVIDDGIKYPSSSSCSQSVNISMVFETEKDRNCSQQNQRANNSISKKKECHLKLEEDNINLHGNGDMIANESSQTVHKHVGGSNKKISKLLDESNGTNLSDGTQQQEHAISKEDVGLDRRVKRHLKINQKYS